MKANLIFILILVVAKASDLNLEEIREEILENHNYHRRIHQVDDLERDSEIEAMAQAYSEKLANEIGDLVHSYVAGYGENLYYCWSSSGICVSGEEASEEWYKEISKYNFDNPGYISGTGHFTQLVWKSSKKIGCGAACNSANKCYVTCNYSPQGNIINGNYFAENVLRPLDEANKGLYLNKNKILSIIFVIILLI